MQTKNWLILAYLCAIIVRIPRFIGIFTIDGFYLIWEADLLLSGELFEVMLHPTSYFGAYPYSPYPIGSVLLMAFFRLISFQNLWVSIYLYNLTLLVFSTLFTWKFLSIITDERYLLFLGTVLYNTFPFFLQFSYTNVTARTPFLVVFPLILYFQYQAIANQSSKDLFYSLALTILANLFHRMAMVLLFHEIGVVVLFYLIKLPKLDNIWVYYREKFSMRYTSILLIILALLSYITSLLIASIFRYYTVPIPTGIDVLNYYQVITSQLLQKLGSLFYTGIIGLFLMFKSGGGSFNERYNVLLLLQSPFLLLLPNIVYISYLVAPLFIICTIHYLDHIWSDDKNFRNTLVILTSIMVVIFVLIQILFAFNFGYLVFFILISISVITVGSKIDWFSFSNISPRTVISTILIIIILTNNISLLQVNIDFSLTAIDGSPGEFYTQEEQQLVDFLEDYDRSTLWTYSRLLTARVATQLQWYMFDDLHSISPILTDYYTEGLNNHSIKPIYLWSEARIYEPGIMTGRELHSILLDELITNMTIRQIITDFQVPFFITRHDQIFAEYTPGVWMESELIQSIQSNTDIIFSTDNYDVFDLRPLFIA